MTVTALTSVERNAFDQQLAHALTETIQRLSIDYDANPLEVAAMALDDLVRMLHKTSPAGTSAYLRALSDFSAELAQCGKALPATTERIDLALEMIGRDVMLKQGEKVGRA